MIKRDYIFRTMTSHNVQLKQYVDWTHVGSENHQLSSQFEINTDMNQQASITVINAGDVTDPSKNQVAYGESLF